MILEGFEIQNWSCLKNVSVNGLPPTGLVVVHGPNGTGKSSIVAALRACLMDFQSDSSAKGLKRWFPKNGSDKPRVSVTLRSNGTCWRITKQFGSKDSKLESRTDAGGWRTDLSTAADVHERICELAGGKKSDAGLSQLLWLTQADFKLPDPSDFDPDVQAQLRGVLGVLQTPLDDRFLGRVKEEWSRWFGARSKPGEQPKLKKDCSLDKALSTLKQHEADLGELEAQYQAIESLMVKSSNLEVLSRDLSRQLAVKANERDLIQQEFESSLLRLAAYRQSNEKVLSCEQTLKDAMALGQRRADAETRASNAESLATRAAELAEEKGNVLNLAEDQLRGHRCELQTLAQNGRELQAELDAVRERRELLRLRTQLKSAQDNLLRAEQVSSELGVLKRQTRERPAPDAKILKNIEQNRIDASRHRAELEAAAIALTIVPDPGAAIPRLAIDGASPEDTKPASDGAPIRRSVRRRVEITVPGWGRAELVRGSDARSIDQIEDDLSELDRMFAEALAPFGKAASNPNALDELRTLGAEKTVRDPELKRTQEELNRLAPDGLEQLRLEVASQANVYQAREAAAPSELELTDLSFNANELDRLGAARKQAVAGNEKSVVELQTKIDQLEGKIEGPQGVRQRHGEKGVRSGQSETIALGLRQQEALAREQLAALGATAKNSREECSRMPKAEQIDEAIREAELARNQAFADREKAKLSESEETVTERLSAAKDSVQAIQTRCTETENEFREIKGELRNSEGLHQKRAAAAVRVDELKCQTEREILDSRSYDRLYQLFEECREKQLGTVMGPIRDRVLRWARLLQIRSCQSIRFNDQFLPERLVASDGTIELQLGEESIGTIEQIGLMARLALGSTLSTPQEPVVALLDDPLTHSDVVRLDRMRAILKNAAAGDSSSNPPAGPLQIIVFTCHPEWFVIDGAKVIDLAQHNAGGPAGRA